MKVNKNKLVLLASMVWSVAGINIFLIGLSAYYRYWSIKNVLLSIMICILFQKFIFRKLVEKNMSRIQSYVEGKQFFLKFFDIKGFFIMGFMMSTGIFLRRSDLVPRQFIAVFYTGLGVSLLLGGLLFGCRYIKMTMDTTGHKIKRAWKTKEVCHHRSFV